MRSRAKVTTFSVAITLLCAGLLSAQSTAPKTLPNFQFKLVDGKMLSSKDLVGKVTVVDFWGTWCKPCVAEIPDYNSFFKAYNGKDVQLLALAADSGTVAEVREAAKRLNMQYPVAAPELKELDIFGDISVFPTTMIFGPHGKLEREIRGATPTKHKTLRETVDRLLKEK